MKSGDVLARYIDFVGKWGGVDEHEDDSEMNGWNIHCNVDSLDPLHSGDYDFSDAAGAFNCTAGAVSVCFGRAKIWSRGEPQDLGTTSIPRRKEIGKLTR